jgi:hypothetical protein
MVYLDNYVYDVIVGEGVKSKKYAITPYTKKQAEKLGVVVKPSKTKKIDVFDKDGKLLVSVGGRKDDGTFYGDYPTYIIKHGKEVADEIRKRYKARHEQYRKKVGTPSYYADQLLW